MAVVTPPAVSRLSGWKGKGWCVTIRSARFQISSGAATLLTNDARFVMAKPSVIYVIVGAVMLDASMVSLPPSPLT